jgi:hypothetical protein
MDQATQAGGVLTRSDATQTSVHDMRMLFRTLCKMFHDELPQSPTSAAAFMPTFEAPQQPKVMVSVETNTDRAREMEYAREMMRAEEREAKRKRTLEEERLKKLRAEEDKKRNTVDYGVQLKADTLK